MLAWLFPGCSLPPLIAGFFFFFGGIVLCFSDCAEGSQAFKKIIIKKKRIKYSGVLR